MLHYPQASPISRIRRTPPGLTGHGQIHQIPTSTTPWFTTYFKGVIDEVKIYNRALSQEEIRADYEAAWKKGDLNNNGTAADDDDLALMKGASVDKITPDLKYDLKANGRYADAGDCAMLKDASVGKIELV